MSSVSRGGHKEEATMETSNGGDTGLLRPAGLAILLLSAMLLLPGIAHAEQVTCGETITKDTKLDNDLIGCQSDGIVIGANNVTLDLNGHIISGTGSGAGVLSAPFGFYVPVGYDNVTIENGEIRGFNAGVAVASASHAVVRRLKVIITYFRPPYEYPHGGIFLADGTHDSVVEHSYVRGLYDGISTSQSHDNVIRNNVVVGGGIVASLSDVVHNVVSPDPADQASTIGINADESLIAHNTVSGRFWGIQGSGKVLHNRVSGNTLGIQTFFRTVVAHNIVEGSREIGITAEGLSIVSDNIAEGNGGRGIQVGTNDPDTIIEAPGLVSGNTASHNGSDGIYALSGTTVRKNTADNNGGYGIAGEAEVIDGGGNRAFGNGNPLQCLYIKCK